MIDFPTALQRSPKFVTAAFSLVALAVAAMVAPGALHGDEGKGNAFGKNKDYPYGVNQQSSRPYSIGLWGDLPYSAEQAAVVPKLIADMNAQPLTFTAFDGDLRQGSGSPNCATGGIYTRAATYFGSLTAPAIFTPGDNDWTDCDRKSLGVDGRNSLQELDGERAAFFNTPYTLGQNQFLQEVQSTPLCKGYVSGNGNTDVTKSQTGQYKDVACVENRRWIVGNVVYATLNVQGSCNNLCDDYPDSVEYAARNTANIAWMKGTFQTAKDQSSVAVMFITQADPGFDENDPKRAPTRVAKTLVENDGAPDGFKDFLVALRAETIIFGKPVAYVHGDSHYFRVDKPLLDSTGKRVVNFTRVETFGDSAPNLGDVNWLKVNVDPSSREVFSYEPQIINRDPSLLP